MLGKNINGGQGTQRVPWLTIGISLVLVGLYVCGQALLSPLMYDRQLVLQGEWWRLITGHFVHCSFDHLFWDLFAFLILGTIIERFSRRLWFAAMTLSCLAVNIMLVFGAPQILAYCGLSGALNGLLVIAVTRQCEENPHWTYPLVLVMTLGKILFESVTQLTIFTQIDSQAVPVAHLAGFVGGVIYVLGQKVFHMRDKIKPKVKDFFAKKRAQTVISAYNKMSGIKK